PNARFIILDPNGEYNRVFNGESKHKARVFQVGADDSSLKVPIWFWNSAEWCSIMQASSKAQAPLLRRALRSMRNEEFEVSSDLNVQIKQFLSTIITTIKHEQSIGSPWGSFPKPKNFCEKICKWLESIEDFKSRLDIDNTILDDVIASLTSYKSARSGRYPTWESDNPEIESIKSKFLIAFTSFGGTKLDLLPKHEDIPVKFSNDVFINFLGAIAQDTGSEQYLDFLITRIRTMLSDTRMKEIIGDKADISLKDWLSEYIGSDEDDISITVIDLSLVPAEIIHIVTSVIARMTFEALQRYRKLDKNKKTLPTVLVAEEAHTFIKRYKEDAENQNAAGICTQVFEKIAREGRKFGLGLMLSSQRPSELSPTVLSQCNSFFLHRISNDKDQELVNRLVPDNLRGLLRELPSLPSQYAILLGWVAELPVLVRMNDLKKEDQPYSSDPEFWNVWTNKDERTVDWQQIIDDWQMKKPNDEIF
ncbi:MAG: ATP-binding protein, partial [Deltaproteobacteria bacterium]|nr:ATP-binding protein [Deltaproteobacteria bacterium]